MNAQWFDGKSAKAHEVSVDVVDEHIRIVGANINLSFDAHEIAWPERTRAGSRVARLPDGSSLHAPKGSNFNHLIQQIGIEETTVVRWQQSLALVLTSFVLVLLIAVGGYIWGLPAISNVALKFVPEWVDRKIGDSVIQNFGDRLVQPTELSFQERQKIQNAFDTFVANGYPTGNAPTYELRFYSSKVGPNAFALPGGIMIMTDELVELADGNIDMVLGVLGHELGHVESRHGMRMVSRVLFVGILTSLIFGDYSDLIATLPIVLGQSAYSREFERQADETSIRLLLDNERSPAVMADFFRRLDPSSNPTTKMPSSAPDDSKEDWSLQILISSHPASSERIARFEAAAKTR